MGRNRFVISVNPFFVGDNLLDRPFPDGVRVPGMQLLTGEDHMHADEVRIPTLRQRDSMSRPIFSRWTGI